MKIPVAKERKDGRTEISTRLIGEFAWGKRVGSQRSKGYRAPEQKETFRWPGEQVKEPFKQGV